jgi:GMP synthase (glutamine-hydrolysing)
MRLHSLEHVPFEDSAYIGVWALSRDHSVTRTRLYAGESLPWVEDIDVLAVMGGPMGVHQHRDYPWLRGEKRFIERAIAAGIPVIGVCLGAQLIADVLGARVVQNQHVEIGWFDVELNARARDCPLSESLPPHFTAFHWHGDTFEIPAGAVNLAGSEACPNQAFAYGRRALGLQFHLEYSAESIHRMLRHCADELVEGPFIQSRGQIVAGLRRVGETQRLIGGVLDALCGSERQGPRSQ